MLADGSRRAADLVVAADGLRSAIRESLGLTKSFRALGNGAIRLLIPRRKDETSDIAAEHWNGNRVLLYNPCTPEHVYLCFVSPVGDERGKCVPVDKETWCGSFPMLAHAIERVEDQGRWDDFETVVARKWSAGKIAIIGDASHGQPPWLGQAANLAFANALAFAEFVSYGSNCRWARALGTLVPADDRPHRALDECIRPRRLLLAGRVRRIARQLAAPVHAPSRSRAAAERRSA